MRQLVIFQAERVANSFQRFEFGLVMTRLAFDTELCLLPRFGQQLCIGTLDKPRQSFLPLVLYQTKKPLLLEPMGRRAARRTLHRGSAFFQANSLMGRLCPAFRLTILDFSWTSKIQERIGYLAK